MCKDRDLLWINHCKKAIILAKDKVYKLLFPKSNNHLRNSFNNLQKN